MKKNTLEAVFSMPDDIFYPTGTNVCVMVWTAHTPHDSRQETFFGYCKDDGFVKRNKLDLQKMTFEHPAVHFISRTGNNNGVSAKVDRIRDMEPYPGGCHAKRTAVLTGNLWNNL